MSYAVYLLHILVMIPLLKVLCGFPWFVQQRGGVRFLILTLIAGPITYGLAWILFLTLETGGIRLGKLCIDRLFARRMLLAPDQLVMDKEEADQIILSRTARFRSVIVPACAFILALALTFVLMRCLQRMNAPLLAVSQTDSNKVTLVALEEEERTARNFSGALQGTFRLGLR